MLEELHRRLRRHLSCRPARVVRPRLAPTGPLQAAFLSSLAFEGVSSGGALVHARKHLTLREAVEVLSWFGLREGRDILAYPSTTFTYPACDKWQNTVLAYIAEPPRPRPLEVLVPDADYVLTPQELAQAVARYTSGARARVYVVSKYARPGNVHAFIKRLEARDTRLYIATERGSMRVKREGNTHFVATRSHRKLLLIVVEGPGATRVIGYRGSMNIFYPGVDDYMESANDWVEIQRIMHGLLRAFLVV